PRHFHSSTISGSASWMIRRTSASKLPRQSPSSSIRSLMRSEAVFSFTESRFLIIHLLDRIYDHSAVCNKRGNRGQDEPVNQLPVLRRTGAERCNKQNSNISATTRDCAQRDSLRASQRSRSRSATSFSPIIRHP